MANPLPRLQLVDLSQPEPHPDRAILDRISDPLAREVYRRRIERMERTRRDRTLPVGWRNMIDQENEGPQP